MSSNEELRGGIRNYQFWVMTEGYKDQDGNNQFVLGQVDAYRRHRSVNIQDMLTRRLLTVDYDALNKYGKRISRHDAHGLYECYLSNKDCAGSSYLFIEAAEKIPHFVYQKRKTKKEASSKTKDQKELLQQLSQQLLSNYTTSFAEIKSLFNALLEDSKKEITEQLSKLETLFKGSLEDLLKGIDTCENQLNTKENEKSKTMK